MSRVVYTDNLPKKLTSEETLWIYNGLDCCITHEILETLIAKLQPYAALMYNYTRAMQGVVLEMQLKGVQIDKERIGKIKGELFFATDSYNAILQKFTKAIGYGNLNPQSPKQLSEFFYKGLAAPAQYKFTAGKKTLTTDENALTAISKVMPKARPFVSCILGAKTSQKKDTVLSSMIEEDTFRCSFKIAGTETFRFASAKNCYNKGSNFQNITDELREVIVAPKGRKLAYVDKEQAESRAVAYLAQDDNYRKACEGGDLHTAVCQMIWKDLAWTDNLKENKKIASAKFFKHFSYRDMAKRGGHGTNYYGQAHTMAKHLNVPTQLIEKFQEEYFRAFPQIPVWHRTVIQKVQLERKISTPLGNVRYFFGDPRDATTHREAIASAPQSLVAIDLNLSLFRLWKKYGGLKHSDGLPVVDIVGQVHDAILFSFPETLENSLIPEILVFMQNRIPFGDFGILKIPSSAETGYNWRHYDPNKNPRGIKKYG